MKTWLLLLVLLVPIAAMAQSSPCGAPTPGQPHVCLTWVASVVPPAVNGYNVYRATVAGKENYASPLNAAPLSSLLYYDTSDAVGTTYFYTVCAIGTGGVLSPPSPEVQAQVPLPPNSPTSPSAAID